MASNRAQRANDFSKPSTVQCVQKLHRLISWELKSALLMHISSRLTSFMRLTYKAITFFRIAAIHKEYEVWASSNAHKYNKVLKTQHVHYSLFIIQLRPTLCLYLRKLCRVYFLIFVNCNDLIRINVYYRLFMLFAFRCDIEHCGSDSHNKFTSKLTAELKLNSREVLQCILNDCGRTDWVAVATAIKFIFLIIFGIIGCFVKSVYF